jgi:hypothetical protein
MLKVIEDQAAIKKLAHQFVKVFKPFIDEQIKVKLGHQGASSPAKVSWSKKLGIWTFSSKVQGIRYWNAFGFGRPKPGDLVSIAAEINFPWEAIDRKTGGAFARDLRGNIFVIHRGKIGGGKKGVGKSLFEHNYRGVWSFMEDGDGLAQVAVVGVLNSARFAMQVAHFVKKVELLKSAAFQSPQTEFIFSETTFREDLVGYLPFDDEQEISTECDRDLIISSLASLLKRWKLKVGNDNNHELFLADPFKNQISHIFEILTDNKEKSVLAAAGKLLLQSAEEEGKPIPILILPEENINSYAPMLQKINISVIGFRLDEDRIIFPDLGKIKLDQNSQL